MKERLTARDWTAMAGNRLAGSGIVAIGRLVQLLAVVILLLALWPTVGAVLTWLKTSVWTTPTPLDLAPQATRAVAAAVDWVVVHRLWVWFAEHHILWLALPVVALVGLAGTGLVSAGQTRSGRAADILSTSLRDEYRVQQAWERWQPRLRVLAVLGILVLALLAAWLLGFL